MKKKVLFIATVADKHINTFHIPYLKSLKNDGYEVHVSAKNDLSPSNVKIDYCDTFFDTPYNRNPISIKNLIAYKQLIKILNENDYAFIHTHTPISSAIVRLIKVKNKFKKLKIIYTAHGFHFYKGSSLLNWLTYYPLEKFLSKFTDVLITINKEDFHLAKKNNFKSKKIIKTDGIGVDLKKFHPVDFAVKQRLRDKLNLDCNDFLLIYPAELNTNKNQKVLIEAMELLNEKYVDIKLILLGTGNKEEHYKKLVDQRKLTDKIIIPGFVNNVSEYLNASDILVASSKREGLPINMIEAMACGLPVVASKNRGHNELVTNSRNGFLLDAIKAEEFAENIEYLYLNKEQVKRISVNNLKDSKKYSIDLVLKDVSNIYNKI